MAYWERGAGCRCVWDCSHAWCGCKVHTKVVCICGSAPSHCPIHGPDALPKDRQPRRDTDGSEEK